jgi:hypothetical protein
LKSFFFGLAESNYTQTQTKSHDYSLKANKMPYGLNAGEIRKKCGCCGKYITKIQVDDFHFPTHAPELDERGILKKSDTDFYRVFKALSGYGGGAWLNAKGEIIGIKTSRLDASKGQNYHLSCAYKELVKRHDWGFGSYEYLSFEDTKEKYKKEFNFGEGMYDYMGIPTEQHLAARKIQRWFRREVRHNLSNPKHPAGFAVMIRGMEEVGMDEVEIAALKLEFKMKRQHKQVKDFFKSMEKSGKKVAKQVAKTK